MISDKKTKEVAVRVHWTKAVGMLLVAGVAWIATVGSAHAAVYRGTWDPPYGAIFPDLGWRGSADFEIDDDCLLLSGLVANANACSGGTMRVLQATLVFYDIADAAMTPLETFSFGADSVVVNGMVVGAGEVTGVNTGYFAPVRPGDGVGPGSQLIAGGGAYEFHLLFDGSVAELVYSSPVGLSPNCAFSRRPRAGQDCGLAESSPVVTYRRADLSVPEPGTLALGLAALGAGWMVRRRRSPVQARA
jgi:hypothetical protein